MFAFIKLPFLITATLLLVVIVIAGAISRRSSVVAWLVLLSIVGFIPSCVGVMYVVDQVRYGRFEYATADDAPKDGYLEFPPSAMHVVVYRSAPGHQAKFNIGTFDLKNWVDDMRAKNPDLNRHNERETWEIVNSHQKKGTDDMDSLRQELERGRRELFERYFSRTGWVFNPDMNEYHVTRSGRGGGYTIWHVPGTDSAIMNAYYW